MKSMKLLRYAFFTVILAVGSLAANAGVDWKALDVGNLSSAVYNTAVVGYPSNPTANPSGWWPAGTNDSYIFEGNIWLGAKKGCEVGVSASDGRQSEIWPDAGEPYPDGTYRSGAQIYFGGLYVQITDGPSGPPVAGDIFRVVSTPLNGTRRECRHQEFLH